MVCYHKLQALPVTVDILGFFYDNKRVFKKKVGGEMGKKVTTIYSVEDKSFRGKILDHLPMLTEQGLVDRLPAGGGSDECFQLSSRGLAVLQAMSEDALTPASNDHLDPEDITIVSARQHAIHVGSVKLKPDSLADYWESVSLTIYAKIGDSDELHSVAKASLLVLDAEAALHDGNLSLKGLFDAQPQACEHLQAICEITNDEDFPTHCYELAEHLGIPEAIGRNILVISSLDVIPGLIGKGVGRRVITKLLRRYGRGGGIVIMPVEPHTPMAPIQTSGTAAQRIARRYLTRGFKKHPRMSSYLVGDINVCAGLAEDHS